MAIASVTTNEIASGSTSVQACMAGAYESGTRFTATLASPESPWPNALRR